MFKHGVSYYLLRGEVTAHVQINTGSKELVGTIIGLEPVTKVNGQLISEENQLVFLARESGSVQKIAFSDIDSFEILEGGLRKELKFLLDTLISGKKKDSKNLVIQ